MRLPAILLLFLSVSTHQNAFSQHRTYTSDSRQVQDLSRFVSVFTDSTNSLTLEEIHSGSYDASFIPLANSREKLPPYENHWLKLTLKASAPLTNWWLLLGDSLAEDKYHAQNHFIEAWLLDVDGKITGTQKTGTHVPLSQKSVREDIGVNRIRLDVDSGETVTVYLKVYNEYMPLNLSFLQLRDAQVQLPEATFSSVLYVLAAIALVFTTLSFFFFGFVKERAYLFFGIYTLLLSSHYLLVLHPEWPLAAWFFPEYPNLAPILFSVLATLGFVFFLLFGRFFINLPTLSKKTDTLLKWFLGAWSVLILTEGVLNVITRREVLNPLVLYTGILITLAFIIRFAFFKSTLARIFVAGAFWLICFSILGFFDNIELINFPVNPWPVAQLGELLIFSIGLAYKIRLNEKAKAEADRIRELDAIKSRFFANISHEFRTPLTLIQGPLQQIEDSLNERDRSGVIEVPYRQLKTMRRNTERLLELVNQLLDLSRLDSGTMKLQVVKGDMIQLLKALTASFDSLAERKQIHYRVHFAEQTVIAYLDKDKLEKILVNLIGNAFKFTPEKGTVSVNIEVDNNLLRLIVEDSGPGIPKKELDKIFDRFYRVEGAEEKGTGIGLSLVKELVELYRGQISVSSEPGKGSRFRISLPIKRNAFKDDEMVYGERQMENLVVTTIDGYTDEKHPATEITKADAPLVLIIEDNSDLRQFIRDCVLGQYNVIEATNGRDGLELAIKEIPDLVISDVMMPIMNGFEFAEKIRKDERTSHIPLILLTAKAGQQHKLEGLGTGADEYLTKPFDARELLARMQNLLQQRKLLRKKYAGDILLKPSEIAIHSTDEIFLNKLMQAIERNMSEEDFGVEELARELAMSRSQLHRKLVALTGQAPSMVLRNARLLRARDLLQKKAAIPSEVAFKVGFNSHTYFSKCFKEEFGISPSEV